MKARVKSWDEIEPFLDEASCIFCDRKFTKRMKELCGREIEIGEQLKNPGCRHYHGGDAVMQNRNWYWCESWLIFPAQIKWLDEER